MEHDLHSIRYGYTNGSSFYGPAPLHHTLLSGEKFTGLTVQTLHPQHFDQGRVLLQTPQPGLQHDCQNVEELSQMLAPKGADMLLDYLRNSLYLDGSTLPDFSKSRSNSDTMKAANARPAPKITTADRFIDWTRLRAKDILLRHRIIGPLWNAIKEYENSPREKRVIWSTGFESTINPPDVNLPIGQPAVMGSHCNSRKVYVRTFDNQVLKINQMKIEGGEQAEPFKAALRARMHDPDTIEVDGPLFKNKVSSILPVQYRDHR